MPLTLGSVLKTVTPLALFAAGLLNSEVSLAAGHDALARQKLEIQSSRSRKVLDETADDIKAVFKRYRPQLDSSTSVVNPLKISGSHKRPVVQITLKKCVLIVCQTVELDAEVSISQVSGRCDRNLLLTADLPRSGKILTELYDRLEVGICYQENDNGSGSLDLAASARRAPNYSSGIVQGEVFKLLKMQIKPIMSALDETLKANAKDL